MKDEDLIRWFRFSDKELNAMRRALICYPKLGTGQLRMLEEMRAVIEMRKHTPHE